MSSKDKIVPITIRETKPKQGSFALIVGPTQVDISIEPAKPVRRRPAAVVKLVKKQGGTGVTPGTPASHRVSNNPKESSQ